MKNYKMNKFLKIGAYPLIIVGVLGLIVFQFYHFYEENKPENVTKVLEKKGFTDVVVKEQAIWCYKTTYIRRHFEANDLQGNRVEGKICDGSFFDYWNSVTTEIIKPTKNKM